MPAIFWRARLCAPKAKALTLIFFYACLFISGQVFSQSHPNTVFGISAEAIFDDNIQRQSDGEEQSDIYFTTRPYADFAGGYGISNFIVHYDGQFQAYRDNDNLNFNLHNFAASAVFDHTARLSSSVRVHYNDQIELPGDTNAIAVERQEYIQYSDKNVALNFAYGTSASIGQIILDIKTGNFDFDEVSQTFRSNNYWHTKAMFFYRLASKTRGFVEAGYQKYDHEVAANRTDQSNNVITLRGGIEWEITGKTTGTLKIGHQSRKYNSDSFSDLSGLSYSLEMEWLPQTYTRVLIGSSRNTQDSAIANAGGYVNTSYYTDVRHEFSYFFSGKARYEYGLAKLNYFSVEDFTRSKAELSLVWQFHPMLNTELVYSFATRQSAEQIYEYDNNQIGLFFSFDYEQI